MDWTRKVKPVNPGPPQITQWQFLVGSDIRGKCTYGFTEIELGAWACACSSVVMQTEFRLMHVAPGTPPGPGVGKGKVTYWTCNGGLTYRCFISSDWSFSDPANEVDCGSGGF